MYIENNGFVVVQKSSMRFLAEGNDFSDEIEYAEVFASNETAKNIIKTFVEESNYEIYRYSKTIWLDQEGVEQVKTEVETINEESTKHSTKTGMSQTSYTWTNCNKNHIEGCNGGCDYERNN